ncbi:hypothetical protein CORC01_09137 [Colletotrichum orchidophilum]|uniref:Uncharacterized protein n=1 Tax=Colletotrichum orchidophilum TaxID=1209926 RepID=A0A1G4B2E7_9PEZI|nr:uncharacterized protein CORC01_09137 [Colletotrichum orchidophilum]OHE95547.1 hypothetical protein CORC01_09137 [Colletotrichum orchidophilum]
MIQSPATKAPARIIFDVVAFAFVHVVHPTEKARLSSRIVARRLLFRFRSSLSQLVHSSYMMFLDASRDFATAISLVVARHTHPPYAPFNGVAR